MRNLALPIILAVLAAVGLTAAPAGAGLFGPGSYEECILENMKGVTSDLAARTIRESCRERFPDKPPRSEARDVPEEVVRRLDARVDYDPDLQVLKLDVYNPSDKWTLTSLTVRITDEETLKGRDYRVEAPIEPLSTASLAVQVYEMPETWIWTIVKAQGRPK